MVVLHLKPLLLLLLSFLSTLALQVLADECAQVPPPTAKQLRAGAVISKQPPKMRGKPGKKKKPVPNFDTFTNGQGLLVGFPKITVTATVELVDDDRKYTIGIAGIGPGVPSGDYLVAFVHDGGKGPEVVKTFGISGFTECWYSTFEETNANFDPIDDVKLIKA